MELDCIRSAGKNVCVSIWIEGQMRSVTVSAQAISGAVSSASPMSDDDCHDWVRTNLRQVHAAARARLVGHDLRATEVFLDKL
jgi:hypothetical protein